MNENKHVKEIITDTDKLAEMCIDIDPRKEGKLVQEIILALKYTMRANNLSSLSAPQIGYNKRIFCIKTGKDSFTSFINPVYSDASGMTLSREKCASLPDKEYIIPRNTRIIITYLTPMNKIVSNDVRGKTAFVVQHCMSHLDGLLLSDIGLVIKDMSDENVLDMWDKATEEERDEVLKDYMASLDLKQKAIEELIESDPEAKQLSDGVKFMEAVAQGKVQSETFTLDKDTINQLKENSDTEASNNK